MKTYQYILLSLTCFVIKLDRVTAQDPHFSQYFSSPLTFNPALTGYFDGMQRISMNLRNQWANVGDAYTTGTTSFETRIMKTKISPNDRWGLGIHALYDQSSGGIYKATYLSLSTAFNKGLDEEGGQSIGFGVQATLAHNSVDFTKISFSNQFNGNGFDLSIPNGETVNNKNISYLDVNAGLLYNYKDENGNQFSFGAAIFHILKPTLSFFSGNNHSVQPRYTIHAGANFNVGGNDEFFLSTHLMQQAGASEYVIGGAYGLGLGTSEATLYVGGWLRAKDAFYPYAGLKTPLYQIGLSYDITSSDIRRVQSFAGSSEISFIYLFNNETKRKGIPCYF